MNYLIKSNLLIILTLLLSSCSTDSTSSLLDDLGGGSVDETNLEGIWRLDSFESYSGILCSGTPTNSNTTNSYVVVTSDNWGTVDTDSCNVSNVSYEWNDSGTAGYISQPNGINRNISVLNETNMTFTISTSTMCMEYALTKVTTIPGCPDL